MRLALHALLVLLALALVFAATMLTVGWPAWATLHTFANWVD